MVLIIEFILKFIPAIFLLNWETVNKTTDCRKFNLIQTSQPLESTIIATFELNIRIKNSSGYDSIQVLLELRMQSASNNVYGIILVHYHKCKFLSQSYSFFDRYNYFNFNLANAARRIELGFHDSQRKSYIK